MPAIIAVEGIDRSGKSRLVSHLKNVTPCSAAPKNTTLGVLPRDYDSREHWRATTPVEAQIVAHIESERLRSQQVLSMDGLIVMDRSYITTLAYCAALLMRTYSFPATEAAQHMEGTLSKNLTGTLEDHVVARFAFRMSDKKLALSALEQRHRQPQLLEEEPLDLPFELLFQESLDLYTAQAIPINMLESPSIIDSFVDAKLATYGVRVKHEN
jgi:hypothetical protein